MADKIYHVGFLKHGKQLVIQVADSVDQLSCELWLYYGARCATLAHIRRNAQIMMLHMNELEGTDFNSVIVQRIAGNDYTAGHSSTLSAEMREG